MIAFVCVLHFCVEDYHVILLHTGNRESYVYDLDTTLPFPCPLSLYEKEAFRSDHGLKESYWRYSKKKHSKLICTYTSFKLSNIHFSCVL